MATPHVLETPAVPDEIAFKGGVGKFCAVVALVLSLTSTTLGCYAVAYSDRPMTALVALVVLTVSIALALAALTTQPHFWLGKGAYRKAWFAVQVFIGEDGRLYKSDNPARPRPNWTDTRLTAGASGFGLAFAGALLLAHAWGWLWL